MPIDKSLPELFKSECYAIADWWLEHAIDHKNGGYYGAVSYDNKPDILADKSVILNTRILWFFSAAALFAKDDKPRQSMYTDAAHRSYQYIVEHFWDDENGGVLWMLNAGGNVVDGRKHTYAQGFAIYALSAYYDLTSNKQALSLSLKCFDLIELHAKDEVFGGYFEARSQDWGYLDDIRLSEKEDNSPKTMNTNLHVLEAYTGLYNTVALMPECAKKVALALSECLSVFCEHVVNMETGHTNMFMNEQWVDHSHAFSFGHDIESSWLIYKAVKSLQVTEHDALKYMEQVKRLGEIAFKDGIQEDGSMGDEYEFDTNAFCESSWWIQAEAMVGLATMWHLGEGDVYRQAALNVWHFVQENFVDHENGEWFWFSQKHQNPQESEYKVGPWKAPYHTGRAMMQMHELFS